VQILKEPSADPGSTQQWRTATNNSRARSGGCEEWKTNACAPNARNQIRPGVIERSERAISCWSIKTRREEQVKLGEPGGSWRILGDGLKVLRTSVRERSKTRTGMPGRVRSKTVQRKLDPEDWGILAAETSRPLGSWRGAIEKKRKLRHLEVEDRLIDVQRREPTNRTLPQNVSGGPVSSTEAPAQTGRTRATRGRSGEI